MITLSAFSDEAASTLDGQIAALERNGIRFTELRNVDGKSVKDLSFDEARAIRQKLDRRGIRVFSLGSPLGKVDISVDIDEYLEVVRHVVALAGILGTDKIRVFSFYNAYNEREKVFDYLSRMVEIAAASGVTLYHENEKDIYGDTAERVLDIMQNVPGLKYIYDPANYLQVGEDARKTVELLVDKTDYFHIKDVIASTGQIVPAGYGDGLIDMIVGRISSDTVLSVEPHLAVFDGYSSLDKSELKGKFTYPDNGAAFDAAVAAIKSIIAAA